MARQAKDIARRLRFRLFPRPDSFRRLYLVAGAVLVLGALAAWAGFATTLGERQYQPDPVSSSHATFGARCENCHVHFGAVPNTKCHGCHVPRVHSEFEVHTPACRDCHVEHREGAFLDVSSPLCVDCHGDLETKRPQPLINAHIARFADHPEFVPLREGGRDPGALRFNHHIHFTSEKMPKDKIADGQKLACVECHRVDDDGRYMRPIVFEDHCERCHEQKVREAPSPIGNVAVPHEEPDTIRDVVAAQLVKLAVERPDEIFLAPDVRIPGRAAREAVDDSRTLQEYERKWLAFFEEKLYVPFQDTKPLLEKNKYCFLCHLEGEGEKTGNRPVIAKTQIPQRWLQRGEYDHRSHDKLTCETCHGALNPPQTWGAKPGVEESELTSDVNLPSKALCQTCHVDGSEKSAGTSCTLCHLYHDTTKNPQLRHAPQTEQSLDALMGGAEVTFHAPQ
jgi:Cytochrome c7 and related cytochrome c